MEVHGASQLRIWKAARDSTIDMNAIRRDEEMDNTHSIYVDQWDWEKVISPAERNRCYLMDTVKKIVDSAVTIHNVLKKQFPQLETELSKDVSLLHLRSLKTCTLSLPKERENEFLRDHRTAFIMNIGDLLRSGERHDGRAPDYDD